MNKVFDICKIALLAAIFILLFLSNQQKMQPKTTAPLLNEVAPIDKAGTQTVERQEGYRELKKVMKYQVQRAFKYPESVKFKGVISDIRPVFASHGINIEDAAGELITARMAGLYSAPNGFGNYGKYEPFYVEISLDHGEKKINGESWFFIKGVASKFMGIDSDIIISEKDKILFNETEKLKFISNWEALCGKLKSRHWGPYQEYDSGYIKFKVKAYDSLLKSLTDEKRQSINRCSAEGLKTGNCIVQSLCQGGANPPEGYPDLCKTYNEVCISGDDFKTCDKKMEAEFDKLQATRKK